MKAKTPKDSLAQMTEMVMPNDTNTLGKLLGGRLLHYMDIVAAIAAGRHANRVCVTAAVDFVDFKSSIELGELIVLEAKLTRAFSSSMEVKVTVMAENHILGQKRLTNQAYLTFVAVDQLGRPIPVNPLVPETDQEKYDYEEAAHRRELRLVLAGKIKPQDAKHTPVPTSDKS